VIVILPRTREGRSPADRDVCQATAILVEAPAAQINQASLATSTRRPQGAAGKLSSSKLIQRVALKASQGTGRFVQAHGRTLTAIVGVGLVGFGVAAFGIAPLAPDAADLPRRIVTEIVTVEAVEPQIEALAAHGIQLYRSDVTRTADTVDSLLARLNVSDAAAAAFLRNDRTSRKLLEGRPGKMVQVRTGETGLIEELVARYPSENADQWTTHFSRLKVARVSGMLTSSLELARLSSDVRLASGSIRSSLFAATDESRIPDSVATQVAEIFSADVDFRRELRKGDAFNVAYEALTADGEPITWNQAAGRVIAAEFVNAGHTFSAVWFTDASGKGAYFGYDGKSKRRSFLASPMEFSRVTSGFSMRMHPILQSWRAHLGVDYGAPTGTAVRVVSDGVVEFAGRQNGYGNVIQIRHTNERTTLYGHLSKIDVRVGQRVEQGQRIGAVGMTGWATGPHLHFEFKVKGHQIDPMSMAKGSESLTLSADDQNRFSVVAREFRSQLDADRPETPTGLAFAE
jgi:murein DD-endopeptidase MepM/ murein hydrolase activator NlpD